MVELKGGPPWDIRGDLQGFNRSMAELKGTPYPTPLLKGIDVARSQFAQFITYSSAEIGGAAFGEREGESPRRRCKSTPLGVGGSENEIASIKAYQLRALVQPQFERGQKRRMLFPNRALPRQAKVEFAKA